jgi:RNA polymerase sigma-70 factor (ECF subfamily)
VLSDRDLRLSALFRREAGFVWRVVRRLGVPDAEAEDAVQEVFLVVAQRLDAYEERGAVRAWLVAIARQIAQHAHRARFRHERKLQALPLLRESQGDPQQTLEHSEAVAFFNTFLAEVDPEQALVFYLSEVEGMSAVEIAGSMKTNLNTTYSRLRHMRRRFAARVKARADR